MKINATLSLETQIIQPEKEEIVMAKTTKFPTTPFLRPFSNVLTSITLGGFTFDSVVNQRSLTLIIIYSTSFLVYQIFYCIIWYQNEKSRRKLAEEQAKYDAINKQLELCAKLTIQQQTSTTLQEIAKNRNNVFTNDFCINTKELTNSLIEASKNENVDIKKIDTLSSLIMYQYNIANVTLPPDNDKGSTNITPLGKI